LDNYSNEYYNSFKNKYSSNINKKPSKLKNIIGIFTYQLIFVLVLTLGIYILKITDTQKNNETLAFVKENIYFKGILPPFVENLYEE